MFRAVRLRQSNNGSIMVAFIFWSLGIQFESTIILVGCTIRIQSTRRPTLGRSEYYTANSGTERVVYGRLWDGQSFLYSTLYGQLLDGQSTIRPTLRRPEYYTANTLT